MRGVRFTKAEVQYLKGLLSVEGAFPKHRIAVLAKLDKANEPAGVDVAPIEAALVKASVGKVVPLEGGHARASVQARAMGVTPDLAALVGGWMARQPWLHGPATLLDVLNKWHQWLPKARATEPPPALQPGLKDGLAREPGREASDTGVPAKTARVAKRVPGFR
jgi:hypothetical protein